MARMDRDEKKLRSRVNALLRDSQGDRTPKRVAAEETLRELGPPALEILLSDIETNSAFRRRMPLFVAALIAFQALVVLTVSGLMYLVTGRWTGFAGIGGAWGAVTVVIMGAYWRRSHLTCGLALFDDVRSIGFFCEGVQAQDERVSLTSREALIRLLPLVKSSNATVLSVHQLDCLNRALTKPDRSLTLAILKALPFVADASTLQSVKDIALSSKHAEVREAAKECLPQLEARINEMQARGTLLHPALAPDSPCETLLRPTQTMGATDPSQLLRASATTPGDPS